MFSGLGSPEEKSQYFSAGVPGVISPVVGQRGYSASHFDGVASRPRMEWQHCPWVPPSPVVGASARGSQQVVRDGEELKPPSEGCGEGEAVQEPIDVN